MKSSRNKKCKYVSLSLEILDSIFKVSSDHDKFYIVQKKDLKKLSLRE